MPDKDTVLISTLSSSAMLDLDDCKLDAVDKKMLEIDEIFRRSQGKCLNKTVAEQDIAALKQKITQVSDNQSCAAEAEVDKAYVVVRLSGSGLYPHWAGGSHKIAGSSQYIYTIVKGDEPLPTLEEISASYRANVCDMVNPWGFGWEVDTPPSLFNQEKPAVKLITVPYKNAGDIDRSLLYSDWKSSGSDGPGLWELKKGCR